MRRHALALLCLLALGLAACGGSSDAEDAQKAAESYVSDLGKRDGKAVCDDMTRPLQRQFRTAVVQADPQLRGRSCAAIMTQALASVPAALLKSFAGAKIEDVKTKGSSGTFTYRAAGIKVDGRVAKEGGDWKVSCCVPGQA
jgi:hypothetical protein